ncbi:coiled-coil domain-containing protein 189 isoform X2 [Hemibagrus wyckioides]|uniref:coiled-coil domain-containing protein 189 isoform X2 n=1 Tax=Hemibagrus wyckioides TaxID=337641 RepID=UPI00266CDBCF|nr:coiled-coil domain-containing protein 189 isoform X2 [Hemibagrus wyckioides]
MNIGSLESCPPKARILLWKDLSYSDAEEITKTESIPEISRILCQALHLNDAPDPQRGILLDLYTNMVLFCRQQKYNKEQTSVLLSIVKNMHQLNTETPLNNMDQCFSYSTELLLCHSVRRPPFSIDLFNSQQLTEIMKYLINTYMRHYLLYKYVFTPQMYLDLSLSYIGMPEELNTEQLETSETVNEIENEADGASEQEMASTEILPETEASKQGELRTIIQKEVKEEVMRLTAHLEKRLQESTVQLNTALTALETRLQPKK